jgi:thiol reductant ABC exporter CydD subunit
MHVDPRLLSQAKFAWHELAVVILLGFLGGLLVILQAELLSRTIDGVFLAGKTLPQVAPWLQILFLIILGRAALAFVAEGLAGAAAIKIKTRLRDNMMSQLIAAGPALLQSQSSGDLIARAIQGIENLDAYFSLYLPQLALAAVIPLAILLFVFPLDLLSGIVFLVTAPLIPLFMFLIGSKAESLTSRQFTALSRLSAVFLDTLQGLVTLKALNQSAARAGKIKNASERYAAATLQVLRVTFLSALVLELVSTLSTAVVAVEIGLRLLYGQLQFQQAFFILLIAPEFYLPLRQLGMRFHAGASGASAAAAIFTALEKIKASEDDLESAADISIRLSPSSGLTRIRFDQVSFVYPDRQQEALHAVSFTVQKGQMTAFVGPSGSGKSTIFQLLLRFLQPQSGQILVDDIPLSDLDLHRWRSQVAWVPQQPYLFQDTLANNIALARPGASLAEIRHAAGQAGLDHFIASLPEGYVTPVGERGFRLSGGQAQQVALARAFLKDAPLLLLDEPGAHLDPGLEDQLQKAIRDLCQDRWVLVIAHRLPTVESASQIIVLEEGQVVEHGDHASLLSHSGVYARLYRQGGWRP